MHRNEQDSALTRIPRARAAHALAAAAAGAAAAAAACACKKMSTTAPIVAAAAAAAIVGYSLYCWRALSLERQSIEVARKELARAQSNNTSAPVLPQPGGSTQPRSWKSHLTGLDKMISELLVEARLLASELNKGGDPMAVVLDPLAATATAERRFMSAADAAVKQSSNSSASGAPAQPPVLKRAESMSINTTIQQLGSFEPGQLPTKVVGVCGMSCCGKSTVTATLRAAAHERGSYVPVICLDDSYHDWMDDEPSREHPTNYHPRWREQSQSMEELGVAAMH